jgi:uncharacterized membrane protein SirB2
MYTGMLHTHVLTVVLFMLIFLVKLVLLLLNRDTALARVTRVTKVPHIIISTLFVATGIYLAVNSGWIAVGNWFWIKLVIVALSIPLGVIAMKRRSKVLALLTFVALVYVYGMSETRSATFDKAGALIAKDAFLPETDDPLVLGEALFLNNCVVCHGVDGNRGLSGSPLLTESTLTEAEVLDRIANGKGNMPAYKDALSPEQIDALAGYVLTLKSN